MAIIGKIREKSWLMLIIVGLALIAFIFTDASKMTGNSDSVYGAGTINGEKVDQNAFNKAVAAAQLNADRQAQQQQPAQRQAPAVDQDQVWKAFTDKLLLDREYEALGIQVSTAEFDSYLYGKDGFQVLPEFIQGFTDETTGMFNEKLLQNRIEEMENSEEPEVQQQWSDSKEYYFDKRKREKYFSILKQGLYVTTIEAKNEYNAQKEKKTISYVVQRYNSIKDEEIEVTDEKLMAFYEEHKNESKYANKSTTRDVRFFDIAVLPSGEDSVVFDAKLEKLKEAFAATENDSLFVTDRRNSEWNFYSSGHDFTFKIESDQKAKERGLTYPTYLDTVFKTAEIGQIVGPYQENGSMRLAKVIGFNTDLLSVRHILIAAQRGDTLAVERAQEKVDSLMPLINGSNFGEMVVLHSDDHQEGQPITNGGKYEDFMDYEMVPEFSDFAKKESVGKIGYVQTDFGFHIIEVLNKKQTKAPILAIVQNTLKPSQKAIEDKNTEVNDMIYLLDEKISPIEDEQERVAMFDTIALKEGYSVRPITIQENGPRIYGFESSFAEDKILKLAYTDGARVGDLINSPIKEKNRYVIAILANIKDKGVPNFEDVKPRLERDFIQEEKAKKITKLMLSAKTLEELTAKMEGTTIQKSDITFANPQIQGSGNEPEVVGALFSALKDGEKTLPLKGNSGVYVIQIEKTIKAPVVANYDSEKKSLLAGMAGQLQGGVSTALSKYVEVIDNRRFFSTNIRR